MYVLSPPTVATPPSEGNVRLLHFILCDYSTNFPLSFRLLPFSLLLSYVGILSPDSESFLTLAAIIIVSVAAVTCITILIVIALVVTAYFLHLRKRYLSNRMKSFSDHNLLHSFSLLIESTGILMALRAAKITQTKAMNHSTSLLSIALTFSLLKENTGILMALRAAKTIHRKTMNHSTTLSIALTFTLLIENTSILMVLRGAKIFRRKARNNSTTLLSLALNKNMNVGM